MREVISHIFSVEKRVGLHDNAFSTHPLVFMRLGGQGRPEKHKKSPSVEKVGLI
jgi:hypothetical protein